MRLSSVVARGIVVLGVMAGVLTGAPLEIERPSALFPGRVFVVPPGAPEGIAHFFRLRPRKGEEGVLRLRLGVRDPDSNLSALALAIDDGDWVRVDRRVGEEGPLEAGKTGQGFHATDRTGYFRLPFSRRGGPHRLVLRGVARDGKRSDRLQVEVRVLGAVFFDARRTFAGVRDLSDLLARRYRDLRELDLAVRKVDPRGNVRRASRDLLHHQAEADSALYQRSGVEHMRLLNELTFRAFRTRTDPVKWVGEGLARYRLVFEPWIEAPEGGRASQIYAATPQLYEYLDEVSNGFGRLRESYYTLSGLIVREKGPEAPPGTEETRLLVGRGDPLVPFRARLDEVRDALENLIEAAAMIASELELAALDMAGDPHTSTQDFPRAEAACRNSRRLASRPLEPRYHRNPRARGGEVRGVGNAEGNPCCEDSEPALRAPRNTRKDRLHAEREHLTWYMNEVRALAHHDLHLVRLWQALAGSSPPTAAPVAMARWKPQGGFERLRIGERVGGEAGATRRWRVAGSEPRRRLTWE